MALPGPDHDVGRVPAAHEVVEGEEERHSQGHPAEPARQAERADPLRSQLAQQEVPVQGRRHGDDVADVGEDVDAHRRAEEAHDQRADHVEGHGPVRHVVLVLVLEEAGQQPILGGLEERPGHSHDGVEHREQQSEDQRDADDVLDPAPLPKMWSTKLVYRVSGSAVFSEDPRTPTKTIAVPM